MEFLYEIGLFATQTLLTVVAIIAVIVVVAASAAKKNKTADEGNIEVRSINDGFEAYNGTVCELFDTDQTSKRRTKLEKKADKERAKSDKARTKAASKPATDALRITSNKPRTFILDF